MRDKRCPCGKGGTVRRISLCDIQLSAVLPLLSFRPQPKMDDPGQARHWVMEVMEVRFKA